MQNQQRVVGLLKEVFQAGYRAGGGAEDLEGSFSETFDFALRLGVGLPGAWTVPSDYVQISPAEGRGAGADDVLSLRLKYSVSSTTISRNASANRPNRNMIMKREHRKTWLLRRSRTNDRVQISPRSSGGQDPRGALFSVAHRRRMLSASQWVTDSAPLRRSPGSDFLNIRKRHLIF